VTKASSVIAIHIRISGQVAPASDQVNQLDRLFLTEPGTKRVLAQIQRRSPSSAEHFRMGSCSFISVSKSRRRSYPAASALNFSSSHRSVFSNRAISMIPSTDPNHNLDNAVLTQ
jgi:hypothetical protein